MSLAGQAVVAIWNGIAPEGRGEFYEWHNREHMPERVGIPGFRRGRRYIAKYGAPEFFTLYEADSPEVLVGQDYLNRLNNPTPLTQRVPPTFFRDTSRGVCRVKLSLGVGQGGCMLTLRFGAEAGREADLQKYLMHVALPPLIDIVSVVGVHLCTADQAASDIRTTERGDRKVEIPNWLVMIESAEPEAADAACDRLLGGDLAAHGARREMERGLYLLQFSRVKTPSWAG
jgi:hypothetical protein